MLSAIAKPFGWLLMWLYELTTNYGVAVILFAIIVKLILLPFQMKSKRSMMHTTRLQPKIKELEKKHGANKQKFNEEVQKLYKEEGVNPMSGCLWSLLPFPILIALYQAIRMPLTIMMGVASELLAEGGAISNMLTSLGFTSNMSVAYVEIEQTKFISEHFSSFAGLSDKLRQIDYNFLGLDLGAQPQWNFLWTTNWSDPKIWGPGLILFLIPFISGAMSFLQSRITTKLSGNSDQQQQMTGMLLFMPLISVYIGFIMPAALGVYWIVGAVLAIIQEIWLTKRYSKVMEQADAESRERDRIKQEQLEAKRKETERLKAENKTKENPNTSKKKKQLSERQEQREKAAEWEKRGEPPAAEEPGRIGDRRYARGRAYVADRYDNPESEEKDTSETETENTEEPEELNVIAEQATVPETTGNADQDNSSDEDESEYDEEEEYEDDETEFDEEEDRNE